MTLKERKLANEIVKYWFPPEHWDRNTTRSEQAEKIQVSNDLDDQIREYEQVLNDIDDNKLEHWKMDHIGRLAYILCCDQFSRRLYQNTADAFKFDPRAVIISKFICFDDKLFKAYKNAEKIYILTPLMHSEDSYDLLLCI